MNHPIYGNFDRDRIFYSDAIPKEKIYLLPDCWPEAFNQGPILFRRDPFGEPKYRLDPEYQHERHHVLGHLADLLDDLCEALGLDPEKAWREPAWREQTRLDTVSFMVHGRIALSVVRPQDAMAAVVKGIS